jgi:hypothetical protein
MVELYLHSLIRYLTLQGALSRGVKWQGCEADHLPSPSAEAEECVELYLHSLSIFSLPLFTFQISVFLNTQIKA